MKRNRSAARLETDPQSQGWRFDQSPAIRDILDHIALLLAEEYVRLMKDPRDKSKPEDREGQPK